MGDTSVPRRRHAGAAARGSPAIAGGERRHPSNRDRLRSNEATKGNTIVAAPLAIGRRSDAGEQARAAAASVSGEVVESEGEEMNGGHGKAHREA